MQRKKRVFIKVLMCILTFFSWLVVATPYLNLADGSFLKAGLGEIYRLAVQYAGFATTSAFSDYTLIPSVFLVMFFTFDVFIEAGLLTYLFQLLFMAGVQLILVWTQASGDTLFSSLVTFPNCDIVVMAVTGLSLAILILLAILRVRSDVSRIRKNKDNPYKPKENRKTRKSGKRGKMSYEEAVASLKNFEVPTFDLFPNAADEASMLGTSVNRNIFEEVCKISQMEREAAVNAAAQSAVKAKEKAEEEAEGFSPQEQEYSVEPEEAEDTCITVSQPLTIIDEGYDGEDEIDSSELDRAEQSHDGKMIDFVSAVGGLKSAVNGDYLYDSSKFEYKFPSETLLKHYPKTEGLFSNLEDDPDGRIIVDTLHQFKIDTSLIEVQHGPTFTLYELTLAKGIRVNTVLSLADNIAMDLAVPSVRILAPIPGKAAIGVEVPNKQRNTIGFDELFPALKSKTLKVPMVLGKTITGDSVIIDLAGAPHMLIAGTTGSGKSVCVNGLICSILYTKTPQEVRMILVDPKMVELTVYNDIPHLLTPVITDPKKAIKAMQFCIQEMERRMAMFSQIGARKIEDYNTKIVEKGLLRAKLPYIVVIIDEFADLMMVVGKELESYIKRITAVARFTGIHLVLATQRPSADVITGIIKSNMPTQIAFAVSNQVNSRIILDTVGAEKLLGRGDMLYASASSRVPQRIQGAFIDSEIESIVSFVKTQGQPDYIDESFFEDDEDEEEEDLFGTVTPGVGGEDLYTRAWRIVADRGEASASYLQRRLSIGYNRAANLIEQMEEAGVVGPARGSKPREILRYPDSRTEADKEI